MLIKYCTAFSFLEDHSLKYYNNPDSDTSFDCTPRQALLLCIKRRNSGVDSCDRGDPS